MKFKGKYVLLVLLVLIIIAGIYAYREYSRKPADLHDVQSLSNIEAGSLVMLFENNESKSNSIYLGKPIEVSGKIAEINNQQDTVVNIILGKKDDMHRVSCLMDIKHINDTRSYKVGDAINVRGICTGYLMDVELNRCVVIK